MKFPAQSYADQALARLAGHFASEKRADIGVSV
jgi:hypothetical protein